MRRASWKQVERKIMSLLGGKRRPVTGRKGVDGDHPWLAPEIKARSSMPAYLWEWMEQAEHGITELDEGKLPIVVIHRSGKNHLDDDLVQLRLRDFIDWFVGGEE
jgi:hypothetical protein